MRLEDLKIVWQSLFPFALDENEYVEIVYDNGDKHFSYAVHVQSFDELVGFLKERNGKSNIAICPNTRKPIKGIDKRTGGDAILRQKAILIDVEDNTNHRLTDALEIRNNIIVEVFKNLPDDIKKAVKWTAYTGGGGLICIELDRVVNSGEIYIIYEWLEKKLKNIKYIDINSFKPAQASRLIGTLNVKYDKPVQTYVYKVKQECEVLNVDEIITIYNAEQDVEGQHAGEIEKYGNYIKNLESVVKDIKARVRVKDVFDWVGQQNGYYTLYHCPFHAETSPSFAVYHNDDSDVAIDFHSNEYYDVIALYQKVNNTTFVEAVKELAKKGGVKLIFSKEHKKEFEKAEALQSFDAYEYLYNELRIQKVDYWYDEEGYHYEITVENDNGKDVSFVIDFENLYSYKSALKIFGKYIGRGVKELPNKVEKQAWDKVFNAIKEMSNEVYMGDTVAEKLDVMREVIDAGGTTDDLDEYLITFRYLKFYQDGKIYIQMAKLLDILRREYDLFNDLKPKELQQLLRKIEAEPVRYGNKRIRLWVVKNADGEDGKDTTQKSGVRSQTIERQGDEGNADGEDGTFLKIESGEEIKNKNVVSRRPQEGINDNISIDRQGEEMRTAGEESGGQWRSGVRSDDDDFYPETF